MDPGVVSFLCKGFDIILDHLFSRMCLSAMRHLPRTLCTKIGMASVPVGR